MKAEARFYRTCSPGGHLGIFQGDFRIRSRRNDANLAEMSGPGRKSNYAAVDCEGMIGARKPPVHGISNGGRARMRGSLDPRFAPAALDANVLDLCEVERLIELAEEGKVSVTLPFSVKQEIDRPRTPSRVKSRANRLVYSIKVQLTPEEEETVRRFAEVARGNALSDKHDADARHMVEAAKYGRCFITEEKRWLARRQEIRTALGGLEVITLSEYLGAYDAAEARRR